MPSDPLPLSPETRAGREAMEFLQTRAWAENVLAIEQEARTLARAEVIAELRIEVTAREREATSANAQYAYQRVLAALSRLGERE